MLAGTGVGTILVGYHLIIQCFTPAITHSQPPAGYSDDRGLGQYH